MKIDLTAPSGRGWVARIPLPGYTVGEPFFVPRDPVALRESILAQTRARGGSAASNGSNGASGGSKHHSNNGSGNGGGAWAAAAANGSGCEVGGAHAAGGAQHEQQALDDGWVLTWVVHKESGSSQLVVRLLLLSQRF